MMLAPTSAAGSGARRCTEGGTMTEREAWLELADYIDGRVRRYYGLCERLFIMRYHWLQIDHATYLSMWEKITDLPDYAGSAYKWAPTAMGDEKRAAFCREQAAQCEGVTT